MTEDDARYTGLKPSGFTGVYDGMILIIMVMIVVSCDFVYTDFRTIITHVNR